MWAMPEHSLLAFQATLHRASVLWSHKYVGHLKRGTPVPRPPPVRIRQCGPCRIRTGHPFHAMEVLYQMS